MEALSPTFQTIYIPLDGPQITYEHHGDTPQSRCIVEDLLRQWPNGQRHFWQHGDGYYRETPPRAKR